MKKRIAFRPSKSNGIFGAVFGAVFVVIGLTIAIPVFGVFGVLWTLGAVAITGMNLYQAFGESYAGPRIEVEDDGEESGSQDIKQRLEQLESLRESNLISEEEYQQKRQEILGRL